MKRKPLLILGVIIILAAWFLFRPEKLLINKNVSEDFPEESSKDVAQSQDNSSRVLLSGNFHGVAHETKGIAKIHQLSDGKRVLRFTDFETSNGPDVRVYLVAAADANDNETVTNSGFIEVSPLKGNIGDQNYELPENIDLTKYRAVTIWCNRFGVNFGTAPLSVEKVNNIALTQPKILYEGSFHGVAHETKGNVTVYQLSGDKKLLRFTDFETSNGPDVRVYLVAAADANDNETVTNSGFVEVSPLKGNIGDQNYELSSDIDFAKYRAVTIWCRRFGVNFATAPLNAM